MYMFPYADVNSNVCADARLQEHIAFGQVIDLLMLANEASDRPHALIEALFLMRRLWSTLIEDLASNENDLPPQMRADLISIGLWVLKEAERIRQGQSDNVSGLIEINSIIRDGLK
jgi:flagellar protein FlaF